MTPKSISTYPEYERAISQQLEDWAISEDEEDGDFRVVRMGVFEDSDPRPLLVWVHPGDACESDSPDSDVREQAKSLEDLMGKEIFSMRDTHRIVVIHRYSNHFAFYCENRVADKYYDAMGQALIDEDASHLWGDELDEASAWIVQNRAGAKQAFLTGAWSHKDWGCVTAVGKALQEAGFEVEVSCYSPSEAGDTQEAWYPQLEQKPRKKAKLSR